MDSRSEVDLCCWICDEIYKDPVLLKCNHRFCRDCVENWWETTETRNCPRCNRRHSKDLPITLNVCETVLQQRASECSLHSEELSLFCEEHQQLLCVVCGGSEEHTGHRTRPIEEAAPDLKEQLEQTLQPLKLKLQDLNKSQRQFSAAEAHIEVQARLTESQIQEQFEKLHQFLKQEEQARIRALREEEEHKRKSINNKIEALSREIEALSETISATEEQLRAADASFLLQYKAAAERVQQRPLEEEPELGAGALIDQAKHLGNLGFNIWNRMKDLVQFCPVVLDPNTAHPDLHLSADLSSVRWADRQNLPENPERFESYYVLGSEGFTSGTHSWEVEVSGNTLWAVGVMTESVQRKEIISTGIWEISSNGTEHKAVSPGAQPKHLSVKNLQRLRVKLDCDKGTLMFSDADTNTHLHTFTLSSTERLFPCFYCIPPLKILPLNVTVKADEKHSTAHAEQRHAQRFKSLPLNSPCLVNEACSTANTEQLSSTARSLRSALDELRLHFLRRLDPARQLQTAPNRKLTEQHPDLENKK